MPPPHSAEAQSQDPRMRIPDPCSAPRPEPSLSCAPLRPQLQQIPGLPSSAGNHAHHPSLELSHPSFSFGALPALPSNSCTAAPPPRSYPCPYPVNGFSFRRHATSLRAGGSNASSVSAFPGPGSWRPNESDPHHHAPLEGPAYRFQQQMQHEHKQWYQREHGPISDGDSWICRDGRVQSVEWPSKPDQVVRIHGAAQQTITSSAQHTVPRLVASNVSPRKKKRLTLACDTCRKRKIRCDGKSPCGPCVTYESDCFYTHTKRKRGRKSGLPPPGDTSQPVQEHNFAAGARNSDGATGIAANTRATTEPVSAHQQFSASHHGSHNNPPHLLPQDSANTSLLSPGTVGGADNHSNGVRRSTPPFLLHPRHDACPSPQFFALLCTVRTAVQLFSMLAISALVPDSLRKWCASRPFDAPVWQQLQSTFVLPQHVDPHLQQSMSFALGLAIAAFVYRTCGPEALLSSRSTHSSAGYSSNSSLAPSSHALTTDEVNVAEWLTKAMGIAMHKSCGTDPVLGVGECHFARGLVMYLLAYSELTVGNVSSARRMCLAALDTLQEGNSVGSPLGPPLPTAQVFQPCQVYLSVSALYHTLSMATRVPGHRSTDLVGESERILSDPAAAAVTEAVGFGGGAACHAHLDLLSLIVKAVNMSSAPRDRVPLGDRLTLVDNLQAAMVTLEAKDPFPPDDPARFASALDLRIKSYGIMIQLARPAMLEALGVKPDGTRLPSPVAAANTPTLDANLAHGTVRLVQLSRWIASQAIDVNGFLQHSLAATAHAIAPAILQAASGVAMMIANSRQGQECAHAQTEIDSREAEWQQHRGAAHSLLEVLHTVSSALPSPVNTAHRMIVRVSHFCEQLDAPTTTNVIPFLVSVERDFGVGSPFPPVASLAAIHSETPMHLREASHVPALLPPILHPHRDASLSH